MMRRHARSPRPRASTRCSASSAGPSSAAAREVLLGRGPVRRGRRVALPARRRARRSSVERPRSSRSASRSRCQIDAARDHRRLALRERLARASVTRTSAAASPRTRYQETSEFADAGEDVDDRFSGLPPPRRRRVASRPLAGRRRRGSRWTSCPTRSASRRRVGGVRRERPRRHERSGQGGDRPLMARTLRAGGVLARSVAAASRRDASPPTATSRALAGRPAPRAPSATSCARRRPAGCPTTASSPPAGGLGRLLGDLGAEARRCCAPRAWRSAAGASAASPTVRWPGASALAPGPTDQPAAHVYDWACVNPSGMASSKPSGDVRGADLELAARCRGGRRGGVRDAVRPACGAALQSGRCRMAGSAQDAEDLLQDVFSAGLPEAGELPGRIVAGHLALPAGDESLPRRAAEPAVADGAADRLAGRARGARTGGPGAGAAAPSAASTSSGRSAAAAGVPGRVPAARRRRVRAPRGRRRSSASPRARRSRRCTRRACGFAPI